MVEITRATAISGTPHELKPQVQSVHLYLADSAEGRGYRSGVDVVGVAAARLAVERKKHMVGFYGAL